MLNSANRAKEAATQVIQMLMKDSMFGIVWESYDDKAVMKRKIENVIQQQIEEYAGNRPIEPEMKVVLTFPDNYSNYKELFWKDSYGNLTAIKLVRIDGKETDNADKSTPNPQM